MKRIPLTQGKFAVVDDEDYESLSRFKWYAWRDPTSGIFYALRNIQKPNGVRSSERMHRRIAGNPAKKEIDHRDRNGLNNQKSNLRKCDDSQNAANRRLEKRNTSGFKGAYWHKVIKKWQSAIKVKGKIIHLGYFDTRKQAAQAYDAAAELAFGEFALTNEKLGIL